MVSVSITHTGPLWPSCANIYKSNRSQPVNKWITCPVAQLEFRAALLSADFFFLFVFFISFKDVFSFQAAVTWSPSMRFKRKKKKSCSNAQGLQQLNLQNIWPVLLSYVGSATRKHSFVWEGWGVGYTVLAVNDAEGGLKTYCNLLHHE